MRMDTTNNEKKKKNKKLRVYTFVSSHKYDTKTKPTVELKKTTTDSEA